MVAKEIIDVIREAAFEVRSELKSGYLESVYQNALMVELHLRGISAMKEVRIPVYYKGVVVGDFRADILVENKVIIEAKAVSEVNFVHEMQLVNYLVATGIDDGLLINFGDGYCCRHKTRLYNRK